MRKHIALGLFCPTGNGPPKSSIRLPNSGFKYFLKGISSTPTTNLDFGTPQWDVLPVPQKPNCNNPPKPFLNLIGSIIGRGFRKYN